MQELPDFRKKDDFSAHPLGSEGRERIGRRGRERMREDFWEPSSGGESSESLKKRYVQIKKKNAEFNTCMHKTVFSSKARWQGILEIIRKVFLRTLPTNKTPCCGERVKISNPRDWHSIQNYRADIIRIAMHKSHKCTTSTNFLPLPKGCQVYKLRGMKSTLLQINLTLLK